MRQYLLRRLLLLIPTLLGILLIAFIITRFVPGGPLEQALAEKRAASEARGGRGGRADGGDSLSREEIERLGEFYGFDRPPVPAFFEWLGLWPKERPNKGHALFAPGEHGERIVTLDAPAPPEATPFRFEARVRLAAAGAPPELSLPADLPAGLDAWAASLPANIREKARREAAVALDPWSVRIVPPKAENTSPWHHLVSCFVTRTRPPDPDSPVRARVAQTGFSGILQGDFGRSFIHGRPVLELIAEKTPVSLWFGFWSLLLTYAIAIPLGVAKAVRHGSAWDAATSFALFFAYSIPGYVIGVLALELFAFHFKLLPHSGFTGPDYATLGFFGKIGDIVAHTAMPLLALTAGNLAMMTMLMKNSLLDNLGSDHVRTAVAKGVSFRRAVMGHAFRNSLVPLATGFGGVIGILLTGNFIIERAFDIDGFGMLSFGALVGRDYPVFLANLLFGALLMLLGNIISDICVALTDPRIRFDK